MDWHLFNTGQTGGVPGVDLGLQDVTESGAGIRLAFIDGAGPGVKVGVIKPRFKAALSHI